MGKNHFANSYEAFVYKSRYARYLDDKGRREDWPETVARYFDFFEEYLKENHNYDMKLVRSQLENAVLDQKVMPSMRAIMTAGKALSRDHVAGYNCAYHPMDNFRAFDEELYILMCGTGDGYSIESHVVANLPPLPEDFFPTNTTIVFEDSKIGWAKGFREYVSLLLSGQIPEHDVSKLRKKGARLKTFGGRSSGPEPLVELLNFTKNLLVNAAGRKLTTLEAHDWACMIASIVVVGGVRRSALISLSSLNDERMRTAKSGAWWEATVYRRLANNSAVYEEKPDSGLFMKEWTALYDSKSGERGLFSREAARHVIKAANAFRDRHFKERIQDGSILYRDHENWEFGCNPCSEILLRPNQFCNLTEVIVRPTDTLETLKAKVVVASILGTFQSCLTKFRYLNKKWQRNCEEERLLGVSLTGIYDNEILNGKMGDDVLIHTLEEMRKAAIEANAQMAKALGINPSAAITCVKPSGTVSALNGTASGIHPRHSPYYIRYARNDMKDPITQFLIEAGVDWEPDVMDPSNMVCFKFPHKSPEGAVFRKELDAISHLELWLKYQKHWCDHKPSVTITVKEHEWPRVGAWVYDNFEWMSGVSFLPYDGHTYKQAPFTDCSKEEYEAALAKFPKDIDWSGLAKFESEDLTTGSQELACGPTGCEI